MSDVAEIIAEAMQLPESERRVIALWLLDTVGDEPPEEIDRAWIAEARRRSEAARQGTGGRVPWDEARARIFSRG